MSIRKATTADTEGIMAVIEEARRTIAALGIDQWQNGSPNRAMIEEDIALGRSFCAVGDTAETKAPEKGAKRPETAGEPADGVTAVWGTFALLTDGEPVYDRIYEGAWHAPDRDAAGHPTYLAIHRVAISVAHRGSGISTAILDYAAAEAHRLGRGFLRIDTHRGNVVMRRMLEKHGFTYRGIIYLENGDERVAYERVL